MKRLLLFFFMLVGVQGWGQVDTLEFTTRRAVADKVFGLLNQSFYGASLIDRSLTEDSMLVQQLAFGNYSTISSGVFWMQSFSDIAISYVDSTYMFNDSILISKLERFYYENNEQDTNTTEEIISFPLGLLLHNVSRIDSSLYKTEGAFSNLNSQIKLNSSLNENTIYNKVVLKNAAIIDLSPDNGYEKGMIVYDSTFISTSPDITVNSMELNLGYGYVPFSNTIIKSSSQFKKIGKLLL